MTARSIIISRLPRREALEARLIFALCFPFCLAAAAAARLMLLRRRDDARSLLAEARAAASSCSSFAFMG